MNLRPLGDRVLIKPLAQPTETESGIILAEEKKPDEIGTVVAVGFTKHPRSGDVERHIDAIRGERGLCPDECDCLDCRARDLLRDLVRREPSVKVGDTVLFSWASGQEILLNDGEDRYLLMRESDLIAVYEDKDVTSVG